MKVHFLQHVPFEGLGCIQQWIDHHGHRLSSTRLYAGDPLPFVNDVDFLIVMGGPMGVHDEADHPWLKAEKAFISAAIEAGKPILGICLGAQLMADCLGAKVYPGRQKEIGWFPVNQTESAHHSRLMAALPESFDVFQWHGDTFDIPAGALHLMRSAACENQAFAIDDQLIGLQFHPEMTPLGATDLCEHGADELVAGPTIQSAEQILRDESRYLRANQIMFDLLDTMFER